VKHGVRFEQAATVFLDPRPISIFDTDHSDDEDRWMTLGISATGGLLVGITRSRRLTAEL
jgi:uncharacterized DUF497 family protein